MSFQQLGMIMTNDGWTSTPPKLGEVMKEWPAKPWPTDLQVMDAFDEQAEVILNLCKPKPHTPEGGRKLDGKIYLYYQCTDCEATLDPNTTRFAELNNCAMNSEWKIRWSEDGSGYNPFCPVCAKARWIGD
jgi:hypothetical protein